MDNNKGQTVFLSVIGIATLLVAIIGATFAYFSLTVTGNENASSIYVQTAVLGNVVFTDGSEIKMTNVNPNDNKDNDFTSANAKNYISKTFTIENTSTDGDLTADVNYYIYLVGTNGFTQSLISATEGKTVSGGTLSGEPWFAYKLSYVATGSTSPSGDLHTSPASDWTEVDVDTGNSIGSGKFAQGTTGNKHIWKFEMAFINGTDTNQNDAQGKSFSGMIQVSLASNSVSTTATP